jgi:hypothetical protein
LTICTVQKINQGISQNARKTKDIQAGKLAAVSLKSKSYRNNYVVMKMMEFLFCLSINETLFLQDDLLELENSIVRKLNSIHRQHYETLKDLDSELAAEIGALRIETKEIVVYKFAQQAKEVLKHILDGMNNFTEKVIKCIKKPMSK